MNFPIHALTKEIQEAVHGVASMAGVPIEAVVGPTLAMMAFAVQGHYDIRPLWDSDATIPASLFTLTIFESGGGKTTIFNYLGEGRNKVLANAIDAHERAMIDYQVDLEIWEQERASMKADKGVSSDLRAKNLKRHDADKPIRPPAPDSHFKTFTTAGLIEQLKVVSPSVGFFTSEAGELFKSYSAGASTGAEVELYSQLTNLWDGNALKKATVTRGAENIRNRRASASFLVQADVAKDFYNHRVLSGQGIHGRILMNRIDAIQKPPVDLSPQGQARMAAAKARIKGFSQMVEQWVSRPLPTNPDNPYELEPSVLEWENPTNSNPIVVWYNNIAMQRQGYSHQGVEAFMNRQYENAQRIAGVISAFTGETKISDASAMAAAEIMEFYVEQRENLDLGQAASRYNDLMEPTNYLSKFFAKQKDKGKTDWTLREIKQYATASAFKELNTDVQTRVLNGLIAAGELECNQATHGTRTVTMYRYVL